MTDYTKLVEALRRCDMIYGCFNSNCKYSIGKYFCDMDKIHADAAAAIEALQALLKEADKKQAYQHDYICELVAEVEEHKAAQPHWVSVEERLPDKAGEYLVAYHPCHWDFVKKGVEVGIDSFRGKSAWAKKKYQRVTHWMPLPEPPQEVQDETKI